MNSNTSPPRKPLRLWSGVAAVALQWLVWVGAPLVAPDWASIGMLGGVAGGVAVIVWWLFFSRAPWLERVGAIVLMVIAVLVTKRVVHLSVSNGMMGMMLPLYSIPPLSLALVASAAAGRRLSTGRRRAAMAVAILLACGAMTLVRTDGVTGAGGSDLEWRWTRTPEERLLAQARVEPLVPASAPAGPATSEAPAPVKTGEKPPVIPSAPAGAKTPEAGPEVKTGEKTSTLPPAPSAKKMDVRWPGFRGPGRDSIIRDVRIETDWSKSPPIAVWRRPIGPGWSSFAVAGDFLYTQEQRGDDEVVACYDVTTGKPVWMHRDSVRFYESNGGAGPRGTPTVRNGRVYAHGATGIVNALDAATGAVVWSRNSSTDTGAKMPGWGFASSPLAVADAVIVASSGRLIAYDASTGKPRWIRQTGGGGYSSPHLATIHGVAQILQLSGGGGVTSVAPADGSVLWQHSWLDGVAIVQPAVVAEGDVLVAAGDMMGGAGMRRLAVTKGSNGWTAEERWTSRGLKPYFNDFVVHKGHAFGFDGTILSAINIENGERKWKGGRYGAGQMVLLPEQDVLLVLSEEGELALVSTTPEKHTELARFKAIEGKTWNHPVLVGDVLLVRNGEEMAAFRLPLAGR
jgi:outer membrane protein assembly factor BamB